MFNFRSKASDKRKKGIREKKERPVEPPVERGDERANPSKSEHTSRASISTDENPRPRQIGNAAEDSAKSERQKLIENALKVHRTQSKLLDDIDDGLKERVRALALKKFLGEDDSK